VFVGNLAWDVSWQDLKDHLRTVGGDVAHVEILRTPDGKSKGCGIATFATAAQALDAVEALSGSELQGRPIFIREDREEETTNNSNVSQQANVSVFVGNLAYETSWQDLKDHMRKAGNVDFVKILSHEDGTSKGCAIVKYQKPPEAARAIRELNNSILDDRSISVREDHEQNHGSNDAVSQLFVGNISYDTTWGELKDLFRTCGDVDHVEVMEFPDGKKKGFATVKFFHTKDAQKAIRQFNGFEFQGRNLEVRFDAHFKSDTPASTRINRDDTVLFVGNLSYETSWKDLKDLFRYCGAVEHVDVMEFPDGRKKGFGTVKFASSAEANAAIEQFNGVEFQGRILEVRWDMKTSRKFEPREKLTLEQGHQRQLFISNLSYDTQWGELKDLFGECGRVERAEILTFPNGKSKGLATVRFVNANDAHAAITRFHGWEFQGRILDVKIDEKA
jgi:RNA recognition motif-containing protein